MNRKSFIADSFPTQLVRSVGASIIGTTMHYALLLSLVHLLTLSPLWASSCGAVVGAMTIYALNYAYVFKSNREHLIALYRFALVAVVGLAINGTILSVALADWRWPLLPAQLMATATQFWFGFLFNRSWTF